MKKGSNPPPPKNVKKPPAPPAPHTTSMDKKYTEEIVLLNKLIRRAEDKSREYYAKHSAYCEIATELRKKLEEYEILEELQV